MTRLYSTNEWHEDIKLILRHAVTALDQHVVFLFNDSEVNNFPLNIYILLFQYNLYQMYTDQNGRNGRRH